MKGRVFLALGILLGVEVIRATMKRAKQLQIMSNIKNFALSCFSLRNKINAFKGVPVSLTTKNLKQERGYSKVNICKRDRSGYNGEVLLIWFEFLCFHILLNLFPILLLSQSHLLWHFTYL